VLLSSHDNQNEVTFEAEHTTGIQSHANWYYMTNNLDDLAASIFWNNLLLEVVAFFFL
jgi:hypothetical protein